ncbi:TetR/AcrR family transcriptional regulator [Arachidicoccus soli]|uniref:TetR/AcrR family transcriptional regulator n=1 Tax=Arachidicoccus soli TaxID=2341117 RepID=A0A386HQY6_9BACT|nr:TetR/AcrR family transcriptional regulator [Arachidicoccus soli]AYD48082.1 TetR/AcrR family transcriptional regulator [Arachidicoccus soli]
MGIAERKIRHKENVKSNILEVAWKIVKEDGWQALSMRKIADAIEYSAPVIYGHFENKEAILYDLSIEAFGQLQKLLGIAAKKYNTPQEQLKAYADTYWNFAFKNKEYYQLMYGLGIPCCGAGKMKPEVNTFRDFVSEAIEKIMHQKHSDTNELCFKTYAFWSVLHGLISIMLMRDSDIDATFNKKVMNDSVASFIKNL